MHVNGCTEKRVTYTYRILSFLVCRCNHRPMSQCGMTTITRSSSYSWREPGDVHCHPGCWVPIYRLGDHMEPMTPRSSCHGMCLLSSPAQGTTQPWSRPGGSLLGSWEPGEMASVCAGAWPWSCEATASVPGEVHACVVVLRSSQELHVLSTLVSNWWAVYVLNDVFTFQRRSVLRTLGLRKFLI
jgi:hypothetical protein